MSNTIDELQREKIELEIKDLKREWYKRKDYLQILLPTTLAMLSLVYALVSEFLSSKYEQLQLQKEQLKLEVLYFEEKKQTLILSNTNLTMLKDSLVNSLKGEKDLMENLRTRLAQKQKEILQREAELIQLKSRRFIMKMKLRFFKLNTIERRKF
ncbi:MAG: hypothetical protein U5K54_23215 [Cytophagales bacterium]|nr:hypothetical protein [Cytophagales bacterium]